MPAKARLGDPISHGGGITEGSQDTLTNLQPAARLGDAVYCAQHQEQTISSASTDVFIDDRGAARVGDSISCGATITGGSPDVFVDGFP
jgi:uncharacterized Zn-binding protein involved in type VI secretion